VCGDERWDLSVYRIDGAAGGILVEVFHYGSIEDRRNVSVDAHYWEKYQDYSRIATTYIGNEAAHAVSDAVNRLKNKLRTVKNLE
jgi:hypothetical protein